MPRLFGEKLRYLRRRSAKTQVELANLLDLVSHTHITKLEAGQRMPSLELVVRVASAFGITTDYLLRDTIPVLEVEDVAIQPDIYRHRNGQPFGDRLRVLRLHKGLSQRDLSLALGLASRAYISNLESGRKMPSPDMIVQVADLFGVTTDKLISDTISIQTDTRE